MATHKQKLALTKVIENRGNIGKAMIEAGYTLASAKNPKNLTDSLGYKELCKEMRLTEELIIDSLVADIKNKPGNRISELMLTSKIVGLLDNFKKNSYAYNSFEPSEEQKEQAMKALQQVSM